MIKIFVLVFGGLSLSAASAQSWALEDGDIDSRASIHSLLLNQLELNQVEHGEVTKIHPRAKLSLHLGETKLQKLSSDQYLSYFKDRLFNKSPAITKTDSMIEKYAGFHPSSNFSFSTRIERRADNRNIRNIIEVLTEGKKIDGRQYFETQVLTFNNQNLETQTYCAGYLYRGPIEGAIKRLYRKQGEIFSQANFKCKTLTKPLCNMVYRQSAIFSSARSFKDSGAFDRLERDVLDLVNYQQIQKANIKSLKAADRPGGLIGTQWPKESMFQHYSGLGESGRLNTMEAKWIVKECKNKMAYFFESFDRYDSEQKEDSQPRELPSRSVGSLQSN